MEIELQYMPDVLSFYEANQNADININEKALNKNRSLSSIQKGFIRQLVKDINDYSNYSSLDANQLIQANDKYRQLMNVSGLYNIKDYIRIGDYKAKNLVSTSEPIESESTESVVYSSNFPGCPKESDLNKGYVPNVWIDADGAEIVTEGQWKYKDGVWEGVINGEVVYKTRGEAPEWEVFIPSERFIKKIEKAVPLQIPMGKTKEWEKYFRGGRKRKSDGTFQTRVGSM